MKTSLALLVSALLATATAPAAPFQAPARPTTFVSDRAGVLSANTVADLNAKLAQFQRDTTTQIIVATFPEIPGGLTLEDFTQRTAEAWGVGQKATDNGAVLFVFPQQREMRIEVGYGLEGALPDATAKRIINDEIVPAFRIGNFDTGVVAGIEAMMRATRGEYQAPRSQAASGGSEETIPPAGIVFLFLVFILISFLSRGRKRGRYFDHSGRHRFGGGFGGFGGGGSSGGGFGSGGGSFGGGGASGRW